MNAWHKVIKDVVKAFFPYLLLAPELHNVQRQPTLDQLHQESQISLSWFEVTRESSAPGWKGYDLMTEGSRAEFLQGLRCFDTIHSALQAHSSPVVPRDLSSNAAQISASTSLNIGLLWVTRGR